MFNDYCLVHLLHIQLLVLGWVNYHDITRQRVYNSLRQSQVTDKQHRIELIPKLVQYWRGFCCFLDPNWLYTLTFIGCQLLLQVFNIVPISTGQVLLQDMKPHTNHVWRQPVPSYQPHVWEASPRTTLPNNISIARKNVLRKYVYLWNSSLLVSWLLKGRIYGAPFVSKLFLSHDI